MLAVTSHLSFELAAYITGTQVGFHNRKTEYIKKAAVIMRDKHGGDIPDTFAGLTALPGVGPKMAHLCLSAAWDRTEGIGVDVHVHRYILQNMATRTHPV